MLLTCHWCPASAKSVNAAAECNAAGTEWPWRHRTCTDGLERREGLLSKRSGRRCWDSLRWFISWAVHCPHSLGPAAFSHRLAYDETRVLFSLARFIKMVVVVVVVGLLKLLLIKIVASRTDMKVADPFLKSAVVDEERMSLWGRRLSLVGVSARVYCSAFTLLLVVGWQEGHLAHEKVLFIPQRYLPGTTGGRNLRGRGEPGLCRKEWLEWSRWNSSY